MSTRVFPVSVMAGQLNPGQHEYSVSAGVPDDDSDMEGGLLSASYGYGLDGLTLRAGGAFNQQHYRGVIAGVVTGLGPVGALSVSVPFTLSDNLSERFSASTGRDGDGGTSSYLSGNYSGDLAYLGGNLNQSSAGGTSGSLSLSGSVLAVPAARSVMLSRTVADTVAVVSVKDTPGVKVTSGSGVTGRGGHLVVPLTSYDLNTVTIEAGSLPLDTELGNTSRQVVPVSQAVVWMPFEPVKVRRYLLQVRTPDGAFVPGGIWAKDERGAPLGFVAASGVLVMNVMDKLISCRMICSVLFSALTIRVTINSWWKYFPLNNNNKNTQIIDQ